MLRPFLLLPLLTCTAAAAPGFVHEIMPILSKNGCNMGACHGSGQGKGNLKLSLRGENPAADHAALTKNLHSKMLNVDDPAASFLLRKPDRSVNHEGGLRLARDSESWKAVHDWIAGGAKMDPPDAPVLTSLKVEPAEIVLTNPATQARLQATATFSDGTSRDVTKLAVYEPTGFLVDVTPDGLVTSRRTGETSIVVRFENQQVPVSYTQLPDRPDFVWPDVPEHNFIDSHVYEKLRRTRLEPSPVCDDNVFLRRVYFDLTGLPPSPEQASAFRDDPSPDRRARVVDQLLASPEYAEWWALKWADLLRVEERILDSTGTLAFYKWLRESFATDMPMDQFATAILTARGSTYQNPPANYYRALREPTLRAETSSQIFLGTRLSCAKCHNHPFDRWTQDDYYGFSAVFDSVDYDILKNIRFDDSDKLEFNGEQIVTAATKRTLKDPRTKQEPAARLLNGGPVAEGQDPLHSLATWLTAPQHPLFAKVMANRAWAQLMGRGIVDPVDDFRLTNPASHPALLDELMAHFISGGMRLKPLLRTIALSRTYQLSSEPTGGNGDDVINYSHAQVRRLPAEALLDALYRGLSLKLKLKRYPEVERAGGIPGARFITKVRGQREPAEVFLKEFGKPPRTTACECERTTDSSLGQVLTLFSSPGIAAMIRDHANRIGMLLEQNRTSSECVRDLYQRFLSRLPGVEEEAHLLTLFDSSQDRRAFLEDLTWSLINSKEFLLRR